HDLCPYPSGRAEFRDLLEEVGLAHKEERQSRCELVDIDTRAGHLTHVSPGVGHGEGHLLHGTGPRLRDVVPADVDGVVPGHVASAVDDRVSNDSHAVANG